MKQKIKQIHINWQDMDGDYHNEWIVTPDSGRGEMGVSYVHVWGDPREGLLHYLSHLPLMNVTIEIVE